MKTKLFLISAVLVAGIALSSCGNKNSFKSLANEEDSVSYALGLSAGSGYAQNLKDFPGEINKDALIEGFIKGIKEDTASYLIKQDELSPFLKGFYNKIAEKETERAELENTKILYENRMKEGVKETESGLQYRIITEGKGKTPVKEDVVKINFVGKLNNGTVFVNSIEQGQPAEFPAGAIGIPGLTEALTMMPAGSKWELAIPPELGFGTEQMGMIPANSVLFFDVELLEILPPKK